MPSALVARMRQSSVEYVDSECTDCTNSFNMVPCTIHHECNNALWPTSTHWDAGVPVSQVDAVVRVNLHTYLKIYANFSHLRDSNALGEANSLLHPGRCTHGHLGCCWFIGQWANFFPCSEHISLTLHDFAAQE